MWQQRVRQVWAALHAVITDADRELVQAYLNEAEQALFWAMNLPDQYHCLGVVRSARQLAVGRADVEERFLIRLALLHDVGKKKGDVSTKDKIAMVLLHRLAPGVRKWGREGRGGKVSNARHAIHVYFHHPERSARLLAAAGCEAALVEAVKRHHKAPEAGEPPELTLLRQADDLN